MKCYDCKTELIVKQGDQTTYLYCPKCRTEFDEDDIQRITEED